MIEELGTAHGRFQWLRDNGRWDGEWTTEPVTELIARMKRSGPYRYAAYRILPATKAELVIRPTCAGCGAIAGVDCQRSCEYLFGQTDVTESLPIQFNSDHQFSISISVVTDGKHFGQKKPKTMWFNSVRCAELFLLGEDRKKFESAAIIGNGERLLLHLGGTEVVKLRRKSGPSRRSLAYKQAQLLKRAA